MLSYSFDAATVISSLNSFEDIVFGDGFQFKGFGSIAVSSCWVVLSYIKVRLSSGRFSRELYVAPRMFLNYNIFTMDVLIVILTG
ncbi:hypothetical protein SB18R_13020 [Pseudomonas oryzihabitans]|nr:hypothetical protein NS201_18560 [Pseudomonas psychrotolerans]KTT36968.1 hypothetical protein SB9_03450 [Pseudomonas psychrotolerans]KTT75575.1 hypothetical protein SB18R_13020 [Pseudomonas psychrotolerans]